ncbi:Cysteine protease ATG4C [Armadillidium vulgare]|nr:Cysteine protease ATG4C [Armadillidium vulgare]
MNKYENDKTNHSSTCKNELANELEGKDQSNVVRLNLEKSSSVTNEPGQFFVLPAGGMHFAVPELSFHVNHFKEETSEVGKRMSKSSDSLSDMNSYKPFHKGFKLPYSLELMAGPGQKKEPSVGAVKKKAPPPSETLLASAAMIKSYFMPSQEKDSNDADTDTVKNKMIGLWHNMKYGWSSNLKTKFSKETPIFLLGKIYHKAFKDQQVYGEAGFVCSNVEDFKRDFSSLSWFTYRRKFPPLPESNLTTDCGWGCMIRSGQMMMFTGLRRHFLPSDWSFEEEKNDFQSDIYKRLMKFFCDDPSPKCPFSLHNLILAGHKMKKKAGCWYGPSCVAYMFKDTVEEGAKEIPSLNRLCVYVAQDGAVYVQDVLDMCSVNKCICGSSNER